MPLLTKTTRAFAPIVVFVCLWPLLVSAKHEPDGQIVEIKCLVPAKQVVALSKRLNLDSKVPLKRVVCFYDTESLTIFHHKPTVILRSRYDSSDESDTTVKVRDGSVHLNGAQCEFDKVLGKERTLSCSVTDTQQGRKEIKKANAGRGVKKIFSKEQEAILKAAVGTTDWEKIKPYGPVTGIQVWKKIKISGRPNLTVERWKLPVRPDKPARVLVEVSAKVPLAEEAKTAEWIAGLVGVSTNGGDQQSETKTRIVLEHFQATRTQ